MSSKTLQLNHLESKSVTAVKVHARDGEFANMYLTRGNLELNEKFKFVGDLGGFPPAVGGVITLLPDVTYFLTDFVDLLGARIVTGANTVILGSSSENAGLRSTGLVGTPLLTITGTVPMRHFTITADVALDIDAGGTGAYDWYGVNFLDCNSIGTVRNVDNFIVNSSAFLNSGGLVFDGTAGTVAFETSIFTSFVGTGRTIVATAPTFTCTRRFRIIYSSFVVGGGDIGLTFDAASTVPAESFILDTVNFGGGGTFLGGLDADSRFAFFTNNVGIENTSAQGYLFMRSNATPTPIALANTFYKIEGTTTVDTGQTFRFLTPGSNRLEFDGLILRRFSVYANLDFTSGSNNVCEFGFYTSASGAVVPASIKSATANTAGRAENIGLNYIVDLQDGEFVEVWCANTSAANNITVINFSFVILEIK